MAADKEIVLTETDHEALKNLLSAYNHGWRQPPTPFVRQYDEYHPPEIYIVRTPGAGIPALSVVSVQSGTGTGTNEPTRLEYIPGSADCTIWRQLSQDGVFQLLEQSGMTKTVYNFTQEAVDGNVFVLAERDKWGTWYVSNSGFQPPHCVNLWDECSTVVVDVRAYCLRGSIYTEVDVEYWRFCRGVRVSVSNTPCVSSTGTGTGTAVSGCCGQLGLPSLPTLTATVTDKVGCCTDVPDTFTLYPWRSGGSSFIWDTSPDASGSGSFVACGAQAWQFPVGMMTMDCLPDGTGVPLFSAPINGADLQFNPDPGYTCLPFHAIFHITDGAGNSCTITVAE